MNKWLALAALCVAFGCGGQGQPGDQFAGQNRLQRDSTGRSKGPSPETVRPVDLTEQGKTAQQGVNQLGLGLVVQLASGANAVTSPLSVSLALGMAATGATGETAKQMEDVLGLDGLDATGKLEAHANLIEHLALPAKGDNAFMIANSIWLDEGADLLPVFVEGCRNGYRASADVLDLQAPETVQKVNRWVATKTRDKITQLVDKIGDDAKALLINAIYFKGKWAAPFDPQATKDGPFRVKGGEPAPRPMMRIEGEFRYGEFDGVQVIELPYEGGNFLMRLVLPAKADGLPKLIESLTAEGWAAWRALESREGEVTMPKWSARTRSELVGPLSAMGMPRAFTDDAEFALMAKTPLKISRVLHEAVIEVDEQGAEAAAATEVEMKPTSAPPAPEPPFEFTADRPFLWSIEHAPSGTILFLGAVQDPGSAKP